MTLQCFSSLDRLPECKSNCPQLTIKDLHMFSAQITVAGPPFASVCAHCCCSHLAVVRARSICPPHPDSCPDFRLLHFCPVLRGSLGCAFIIQYNDFNHWFFTRGRPADAFGCPAMLVFYLDYSAYRCAARSVFVQLLQFAAACVCLSHCESLLSGVEDYRDPRCYLCSSPFTEAVPPRST
jgi:hypothetical protein